VILKRGRGGRRYLPYVLTEQGVAMLSSVLRSEMRAFVRLREMIAAHRDLARKLEALEKKYDAQFKIVFDAIRETHDAAGGKEAEDRISGKETSRRYERG
jgi:hypothetical protein